MSIYYISIEDLKFFFTRDHIQVERPGQNIPSNFVPVTNGAFTHQDVRELLLEDGYEEIPNPDPAFAPVKIAGLLMEACI